VNIHNLNDPVTKIVAMAKLVSSSADQENCGEVKNLISPFQSVKVICLSAVKICGLEILPGAANCIPT